MAIRFQQSLLKSDKEYTQKSIFIPLSGHLRPSLKGLMWAKIYRTNMAFDQTKIDITHHQDHTYKITY